MDPASILHARRQIFLTGTFNPQLANVVVSQMLILAHDPNPEQAKKDIDLFILSGGGCVVSGMAIYDAMQSLPCKVNTISIGSSMSMGSAILCTGTGRRKAMANTSIMYHQPSGGTGPGTADAVQSTSNELVRAKYRLARVIARHSGVSQEQMDWLFKEDNYLTPEEALKLNLIDEIIEPVHNAPYPDAVGIGDIPLHLLNDIPDLK